MERLKERRSLAHIADKFNTAPPPGYVAGRGRGISGFSKPLVPPKGRGGGGGASSCEAQGGGSSSAALVSGGNMGEAYEADATDTRELDLSETTRFEKDDLSMDSAEAGGKMEPFNMSAERKEGQFDDDFNYVWNRKGDDPDDVKDAWLGEVDAGAESAEKVEKRRKLLQRQIETQQQPDESPADVTSLLMQVIAIVKPGESVASALRRLSGASQRQKRGSKRAAAGADAASTADSEGLEDVLHKQQFDELTEAADTLLRTGRFDIYSEKYERVREQLDELSRAQPGEPHAGATISAQAAAAAAAGIDAQMHAGAVAGGFTFLAEHGVYANHAGSLYFDPQSSLYWAPDGSGVYYYWDSASGEYAVASGVGNSPATAGSESPLPHA